MGTEQPVIVTERPATDWTTVQWRQANKVVQNLRRRIFRARRQGDLKKVRSLQRLLLRSYSNRLVAVRRVTQVNKGKYTPGTDKLVVKTPERRAGLVDWLASYHPGKAKPTRRVYLPKANGQLRPLGIPSIIDRAIQALVLNALEPDWEQQFEGCSYGFRPGRSVHDAIARIFVSVNGRSRKRWVLDADIKGAFDNIDHDHLLNTIGNFPARELIRQWLKAGYVDKNVFHETDKGTPQGGVISPLLANIALHGMEEALGIHYGSRKDPGPVLVRYADDFVVLTETEEEAKRSAKELRDFLAQRGFQMSEEKTHVVHITEGFDFLGFNVKLYKTPARPTGWTLLIKPSKDAVKRIRVKLKEEWKKSVGKRLNERIPVLNRIIRGWANYYRGVVSARTFSALDYWMYRREWRYAQRTHKEKSRRWCQERYWGQLNPQRQDRWVFGDKETGQYIWKFSWTHIQRHVLVKGKASPDDPELKDYWESRITAKAKGLPVRKQRIARRQHHRCPRCGEDLDNDELIEMNHINGDRNDNRDSNLELLHLYCHQQFTAAQRKARGR